MMVDRFQTRELSPCELCGGRRFVPMYASLAPVSGRPMTRCTDCGLVQANPRNTGEVEAGFYRNAYYESPTKAMEHVARTPMFRTYVRRIQRFREGGRLLDIGCGPAHFLRLAREGGFDVWGLDVSEKAVREASRLLPGRIRLGTLMDIEWPARHFDAATMFNVLDHLPDPLHNAGRALDLLKPGGFLLTRLPNGSVHRLVKKMLARAPRLTERYKLHELTPFHQYEFPPAMMKRFFLKAGFHRLLIENAPVTSGDPGHSVHGLRLLVLITAKRSYAALAALLSGLTFRRLVAGTSLDCYAFKKP